MVSEDLMSVKLALMAGHETIRASKRKKKSAYQIILPPWSNNLQF